MWNKMNKELICLLGLSVCFMLLFAADFTMVNMQKIVVSSIAREQVNFNIEGYMVTGITYSIFAATLWFGPYLTYALGPKTTMVVAAIGYLVYISSYLTENAPLIYLGSVAVGVGAGMLWPAQGQYLIGNSSSETTGKNVAIFWIIFMSSSMMGNIFMYFTFHNKKYIDKTTRRTAVYILSAITIVAIMAFMMLPKPINNLKPKDYGPFKTMKQSWRIFSSYRMMWLSITFCYAGLQQSFWNGIYSPSIGFTLAFGNSSKELVALSGIFMSIGAILGALCPLLLSSWIRSYRFARRMIVLCGVLAQGVAYVIAYINLPDNAVFGDTDQVSLVQPPSAPLALLGSLLLNFGDSCLSTQIYSFIGDYYRENSAESAALFKFVKGILVAMSFFWCNHIGLHTQLSLMAVMAVVGVIAFSIADHDNISRSSEKMEAENMRDLPCEKVPNK